MWVQSLIINWIAHTGRLSNTVIKTYSMSNFTYILGHQSSYFCGSSKEPFKRLLSCERSNVWATNATRPLPFYYYVLFFFQGTNQRLAKWVEQDRIKHFIIIFIFFHYLSNQCFNYDYKTISLHYFNKTVGRFYVFEYILDDFKPIWPA